MGLTKTEHMQFYKNQHPSFTYINLTFEFP